MKFHIWRTNSEINLLWNNVKTQKALEWQSNVKIFDLIVDCTLSLVFFYLIGIYYSQNFTKYHKILDMIGLSFQTFFRQIFFQYS